MNTTGVSDSSQVCEFQTWDGLRLFHRAWPSRQPARRFVVLFHGGHEHSGRFHELVEGLGRSDTAYFAWDARGHGRSPGRRGYAESLRDVIRDVERFLDHLATAHALRLSDTVLLGHSVGSVVVIAYVRDHQPPIRGMILGSPALHVKTYTPFDRVVLRSLIRLNPEGSVKSYVIASLLTHDPEEMAARTHDPLISRPIGLKILLNILEEGQRLIHAAPAIRLPTLILSAGSDWVVQLGAVRRFFSRLGAQQKAMVVYPGFFHEVFHERERAQPIAKAREFIHALFEGRP